jgi:hypothetical protein
MQLSLRLLNCLQRRVLRLTDQFLTNLLTNLLNSLVPPTAFIVREPCLPSHFLAIEVYSCGADHLENTSTILLNARVC